MICFDFTIMPCINIKNMSRFLRVVQVTVKTMNKCDGNISSTNQANFHFQKEGLAFQQGSHGMEKPGKSREY